MWDYDKIVYTIFLILHCEVAQLCFFCVRRPSQSYVLMLISRQQPYSRQVSRYRSAAGGDGVSGYAVTSFDDDGAWQGACAKWNRPCDYWATETTRSWLTCCPVDRTVCKCNLWAQNCKCVTRLLGRRWGRDHPHCGGSTGEAPTVFNSGDKWQHVIKKVVALPIS